MSPQQEKASCSNCAHYAPRSLGKPGPLANYSCAVFGPLHYCDEWKERSVDQYTVQCPRCKRKWSEYGCEQHACIELFGECMACRTQSGWFGTDVGDIMAKRREMKMAPKQPLAPFPREQPPLTAHKANDLNRQIEIIPVGKRGPGNAFNEYHVRMADAFVSITFMNGFVSTPNGLSHEVLLAILIHRLEGFQAGAYACRENALALTKLQEALMWLNHRTHERQARGVENTPEK